MKKHLLDVSILVILLCVVFSLLIFDRERVFAGAADIVSKWAWSDNVGWISFNRTDCDPNNDGASDGASGCPSLGTPIPNYGGHVDVLFPGDVGFFSGFAWSDHIGWIKLNPTTVPPEETGPAPAKLDFTATGTQCATGVRYDVCGWARACGAVLDKATCEGTALDPEAAGWDGWIQTRGIIGGTQAGLLAWWRFDETAGIIASDSSGNGHDGTLKSADLILPTWYEDYDAVNQILRHALNFGGSDKYVDLEEQEAPGTWFDADPDQITLTAWVKPGDLGICRTKTCRIISKAEAASDQKTFWSLSVQERSKNKLRMQFKLRLEGVSAIQVLETRERDEFRQDKWIHVAATYDGQWIRLYQDGALADERNIGLRQISRNPLVPAWIGGNPTISSTNPWRGLIDDMRIYDRALSDEEIAALALRVSNRFGTKWNPSTRELEGWAWGSEVVGWTSFNCKNDHNPLASGIQAVCAASNYQVLVDLTTPKAESPAVTQLDHCFVSSPAVKLSWVFKDDDLSEKQSGYRVQISEDSLFSVLALDSCPSFPSRDGTCVAGTTSLGYAPLSLAYGTVYYWRIMVWDDTNMRSDWVVGPSFTTRAHAAPNPSFTYLPLDPTVGEVVEFTDWSTCYNGPCKNNAANWYRWDFDEPSGIDCDSNGNPACRGNQSTSYSTVGERTVLLWVQDEILDGLGSCRFRDTLNVLIPFPGWKEISPF